MKKTLYLIPIILASVFLIMPVRADDSFTIKDFSADIVIQDSGVINVTETINTDFLQEKHGIFRDIPTTGIHLNISAVTDENGNPYQYSETYFGEGKRLQIGDPDKTFSGPKTYKIIYEVTNVIRFFPDHDELYWNATGNEWQTGINKASATIKLPAKVKGAEGLQFKCYTGADYSTSEDCAYKYDKEANSVTFTSNNPLPDHSGLTIVVGVPAKTFPKPATISVSSEPSKADVYLDEQLICSTNCTKDDITPGRYTLAVKKFGYAIPAGKSVDIAEGGTISESFELKEYTWFSALKFIILLFFIAIGIEPIYTFRKKGRDPKGRGVIIPQYEAPDGLAPIEVGTIVDERVDMRDLTSTIVDLCVRGFLKIKVLPKAQGLIFKTDDYELIQTGDGKLSPRKLTEFEKMFMDKIFGSATTKKVSDLQNTFYKSLPLLKDTLYKELVDKGYFPASPSKVRTKYFVKGFIFIFIGIFLTSFETISFGTGFSVLVTVNGILTLILSNFMPKKTDKGVTTREHILGLKYYMKIAEKDRLKFQEKENIFYELLPYAMTLKIADKWSKAFKDIYKQPPDWYVGHRGAFNAVIFANALGHISTTISTSFASQPGGGKGGSGFSGGFSGGGFGGGGGGSW